jgi:hypothetical protein
MSIDTILLVAQVVTTAGTAVFLISWLKIMKHINNGRVMRW